MFRRIKDLLLWMCPPSRLGWVFGYTALWVAGYERGRRLAISGSYQTATRDFLLAARNSEAIFEREGRIDYQTPEGSRASHAQIFRVLNSDIEQGKPNTEGYAV